MKYLIICLLLALGKTLSAQSVLPSSTTHYVTLTWKAGANNGDPAVGFFAYRSPSGTNKFAKIDQTPVTPTTYNDSTMLYGFSYDYYITSVDSNGVESTPSNTITIAVPFVPYTPVIGTITTGS